MLASAGPPCPSPLQVPTTVMSQVDSSVGGKTGVNHPLGKNMIGAFYQPRCVLIDTCTLDTLPARELASGVFRGVWSRKEGLFCGGLVGRCRFAERRVGELVSGECGLSVVSCSCQMSLDVQQVGVIHACTCMQAAVLPNPLHAVEPLACCCM